jgi:hypothetical protein
LGEKRNLEHVVNGSVVRNISLNRAAGASHDDDRDKMKMSSQRSNGDRTGLISEHCGASTIMNQKPRRPSVKSEKTRSIAAVTPLAKGQKWRLKRGDAEILHIGRTLVQYRFIKTGMARGTLEMKSIANFAEALKLHKAVLIS